MTDNLITLGQIRAAGPCGRDTPNAGFGLLLTNLGQPLLNYDKDFKVSFGDIAKSNGAGDAFWCLRCLNDLRVIVAAIMPAVRRAAAHTTDKRVHDCIATIEAWLAGDNAVDLWAAAWAAEAAAAAAGARARAERGRQVADLIEMFPLHALKEASK